MVCGVIGVRGLIAVSHVEKVRKHAPAFAIIHHHSMVIFSQYIYILSVPLGFHDDMMLTVCTRTTLQLEFATDVSAIYNIIEQVCLCVWPFENINVEPGITGLA